MNILLQKKEDAEAHFRQQAMMVPNHPKRIKRSVLSEKEEIRKRHESTKATFGAFNQGEFPTIACFNKATILLGVDFDALIAAMQVFVDEQIR